MFSSFDTGTRPSEAEPERFYHGFVLGLLTELSGRYLVTSNRESGFGRYDVLLKPEKGDDGIILEFKVQDLEEEKEKDVIILDVRTQEEYDSGHIKNAVCLPNEDILSEPDILPDKGQQILVYCRSGNRSKQAAQKLADMGYENVLEFGGILDWPYPELVE